MKVSTIKEKMYHAELHKLLYLNTCSFWKSHADLAQFVEFIRLCFFSLMSSVVVQAQLIAQSIGQAFSVAYQEFLRANGINPEDLSQKEYSDIINTQEMYNDDLIHFSNSENCKEVSAYPTLDCLWMLQIGA